METNIFRLHNSIKFRKGGVINGEMCLKQKWKKMESFLFGYGYLNVKDIAITSLFDVNFGRKTNHVAFYLGDTQLPSIMRTPLQKPTPVNKKMNQKAMLFTNNLYGFRLLFYVCLEELKRSKRKKKHTQSKLFIHGPTFFFCFHFKFHNGTSVFDENFCFSWTIGLKERKLLGKRETHTHTTNRGWVLKFCLEKSQSILARVQNHFYTLSFD